MQIWEITVSDYGNKLYWLLKSLAMEPALRRLASSSMYPDTYLSQHIWHIDSLWQSVSFTQQSCFKTWRNWRRTGHYCTVWIRQLTSERTTKIIKKWICSIQHNIASTSHYDTLLHGSRMCIETISDSKNYFSVIQGTYSPCILLPQQPLVGLYYSVYFIHRITTVMLAYEQLSFLISLSMNCAFVC